MKLKKETRILVLDRINNDKIIAVVLRGSAGIESIILINNCKKLTEFLELKKGVAGEINYVLENNICEVGIKTISIMNIKNREILRTIEEVMKIIKKIKISLLYLKQKCLNLNYDSFLLLTSQCHHLYNNLSY